MLAAVEILTARWALFVAAVVVFLALDLGVFHRRAHIVRFREALAWTCIWFTTAMLFAWVIAPQMVDGWGPVQSGEFVTGYILELSLSMDNVFVIAVIFSYFGVPREYQHRVLFWGILGALVMRAVMILGGVALVRRFDWLLYVLGAFLVFTGIKMLFGGDPEVHPERNWSIRLARKFCPVTTHFDGEKFLTRLDGRRALTPLALVLLMVETTDIIFAVDSIPAIFGVTQNEYIVFTSNVFAILGLRSLYFVLAGAISYFQFLKYGLALVLGVIGLKMILTPWVHFSTQVSLAVVLSILGVSIVISLLHGWRQKRGKA
ncbi:MAG: TerC family protein [Verrucomicrobiae bacterium]|nr:TerC family protein [Verrucomicrobiae bacterium]